MDHAAYPTIIGSAGVTLLLTAFFLNLFKFLRSESYLYMGLNLLGAALAGYSSYLIGFMPFVLLEATWATVSGVGVVRKVLADSSQPRQ